MSYAEMQMQILTGVAPSDRLVVIVPLPPHECHQNARGHWSGRAEATATYRMQARVAAIQALSGREMPKRARYAVHVVLHLPNARQDESNVFCAMKAAFDGIADAMGVNDKNFKPWSFDSVVERGVDGHAVVTLGARE